MGKATEAVVSFFLAALAGVIAGGFAGILAGVACASLALGEPMILIVYLAAIGTMLFTSYKTFQKLQNP